MAKPNKTQKEQLPRIKKCVEAAFEDFKPNIDRFHQFQRFVFQSTLTESDENVLDELDRPKIEFNISNAPLDRLCGEYSKQEPSIYVGPASGAQVDPALLMVLEGYIRHILDDAKIDNTQYEVYKDTLSGGFSNYKIFTEYENEWSFDQTIRLRRNLMPTMVYYDPMARKVTKSDAKYYGEIYPMLVSEFEKEHPGIRISDLSFMKSGEFSWSFRSGGQDVLLIAEHYELKKKKTKIVKLSDKNIMTMDQYKEMIEKWEDSGRIEQPPDIVDDRWTDLKYFCRYQFIETEIFDYEETIFCEPSFVFVDGSSVIIKNSGSGTMRQFTKPYVYHLWGLQKLVNLAGQTIAADIENTTMHKFMVSEEALPDNKDYLDALLDVQKPATVITKAFAKDEAGQTQQLPPPQAVSRVPLPPESGQIFNGAMQMLQNILGSYDASLGINNSQLSGVAIVEGATQSNAAAMPYVVNNVGALNQVGQVLIQVIPKIHVTPRSLPIITPEGKREFVLINQPGGISINYDASSLHVKIEAGVNFAVAQQRALEQIISLMKVSPQFNEFMNAKGLPILLDNMQFRGVDIVKKMAEEFVKQQEAQEAQQGPQPNPEVINAQANQMRAQAAVQDSNTKAMQAQQQIQQGQIELAIKAQDSDTAKRESDTDRLQVLAEIGTSQDKLLLDARKIGAEEERTQVEKITTLHDAALKHQDQEHRHLSDILHMGKELSEKDEPTTEK